MTSMRNPDITYHDAENITSLPRVPPTTLAATTPADAPADRRGVDERASTLRGGGRAQ